VLPDFRTLCDALSTDGAVNIFKLQQLLLSIGWVLSKSELERLRQTLDAGDDAGFEGGVSVAGFLHLMAEATAPSRSGGATELVAKIARTELLLELSRESVGSDHEAASLERRKPWQKTLHRKFQRDSITACPRRETSDVFARAAGGTSRENSTSSINST